MLAAIQVEADKVNASPAESTDARSRSVSKDDQSTPATGVAAANDLVSQKVDVRHGGLEQRGGPRDRADPGAGWRMAITTIPQNSKILGGRTMPRPVNAGNAVGGYVAAKYLTGTSHAKNIGAPPAERRLRQGRRGPPAQEPPADAKVATEQSFAYTDTDFRVALSSLQAAKPDAIFSPMLRSPLVNRPR